MRRAMAGLVLGSMALALSGGCAWLMEEPVRRVARPHAARASLFAHPWVWTDERGESVTFTRWRGKPLVVATIFTTCRMTCPRTVHRMRDVEAQFRREGRDAQFLLVTLDPTTDKPERLSRYKQTERLPASWHLLAGTRAETRELTDFLDIHVMDADEHIMHDARIVVFDGRGMATRSLGGWALDSEDPLL